MTAPNSSAAMAAYPKTGMPCSGGSHASAAPAANSAAPLIDPRMALPPLRASPPLSACAGDWREAARAGLAAPKPDTTVPMTRKATSIEGAGASSRALRMQLSVAEIAAQEPQRRLRERYAEDEADDRARQSDEGALAEQRRLDLAGRCAERAHQAQRGAPAQHGQRLRGEHQKRARQQGHQRQHVEIDAIGAGHREGAIALDLRRDGHGSRRRGGSSGGCGKPAADVPAVEAQIDAVQPADVLKRPLRRADIHDPEFLAVGAFGQHARPPAGAALRCRPRPSASHRPSVRDFAPRWRSTGWRPAQTNRRAFVSRSPISAGCRAAARNGSRPRIFRGSRCPGIAASSSSTGLATRTSGSRASSANSSSGKPSRGPAHHHIGLADQPLGRQREVDQSGRVDQIDGRTQRDPEGDGEHRDREPQRLLAQLGSDQDAPHGPSAGKIGRAHQPLARGASPCASST